MPFKCGVVMDPIQSIHYKKDSTLAMLWEAQAYGCTLYYFEPKDLFLRDGKAYGVSKLLEVKKDPACWYEFHDEKKRELTECDVILMRKDPPFNLDYIYATYVLEAAERAGVLVVNKPQSLRDTNEKLTTIQFPECCPPTLVTHHLALLREFLFEQQDIICKPLDAMGGYSVFRVQQHDLNANVIFEVLTQNGQQCAMAQKYIPEIVQGDKRILLIDGEPIPFALARIPSADDLRGNLVKGATGVAQPLTERDRFICARIRNFLQTKGLLFAGIDVIGDYLTEINVTSPTCIRELDEQCGLNISQILLNRIVALLRKS